MNGHDERSEARFADQLADLLLHQAPSRARPGLLSDVLEQTSNTRQLGRRAWWRPVGWSRPGSPPYLQAALVGILVVAVGSGLALLGGRLADGSPSSGSPGVGSGSAESAAPASPPATSPGSSPRPAWLTSASTALDAGVRYYFDLPVRVTFSVPAGWSFASTGQYGSVITNEQHTAFVAWFVAENLFRDPCHWLKGTLDPPVGPAVSDMVGALKGLPGFVATGPTPATIGGLPAQQLALVQSVSAPGCDGDQVKVWSWTPNGTQSDLYGGTSTISVLNVGGTRVLVTTWTRLEGSADTTSDVGAIVGSIRFE
jgi:hypothetical protein